MKKTLRDQLEAHPIIAAVRDDEALQFALSSPVKIIFLLAASLCDLPQKVMMIKDQQKKVFIHLEMVAGLSKDPAAVDYIGSTIKPTGVITTKPNLTATARQYGLQTVQRLFMLDSLSIQTGLKMVRTTQPDFIEIMPGIIAKVIPELKENTPIPIIAGGMISCKKEIITLLKTGVLAVSTSKKELWHL